MHEHEEHPLVKEVPGHLFHFEEKVFGTSLTQLLSDIGAGVGILSITASLPLAARIAVSVPMAIPVLILVHGKVQEQTLLHWLYLYGRQLFVPKHTAWRSLDELVVAWYFTTILAQRPSVIKSAVRTSMSKILTGSFEQK
jgi:hypothetical protein